VFERVFLGIEDLPSTCFWFELEVRVLLDGCSAGLFFVGAVAAAAVPEVAAGVSGLVWEAPGGCEGANAGERNWFS